jgi:hypothetical protein
MPTWDASQCVDDTTPNVPEITGRVVKLEGDGMSCPERFDIRDYRRFTAGTANAAGGFDRAAEGLFHAPVNRALREMTR